MEVPCLKSKRFRTSDIDRGMVSNLYKYSHSRKLPGYRKNWSYKINILLPPVPKYKVKMIFEMPKKMFLHFETLGNSIY